MFFFGLCPLLEVLGPTSELLLDHMLLKELPHAYLPLNKPFHLIFFELDQFVNFLLGEVVTLHCVRIFFFLRLWHAQHPRLFRDV